MYSSKSLEYNQNQPFNEADFIKEKIEQEINNGLNDLADRNLNNEENDFNDYVFLSEVVLKNLDKYSDYHQFIAELLIDKNYSGLVIDNFEKFKNLNIEIIFNKLIESEDIDFIFEKRQVFNRFINESLANKLISLGRGDSVAKNIYSFKGIDSFQVANKLIDSKQEDALAFYIDRFSDLDSSIANKLIDSSPINAGHVFNNLYSFVDLDQTVAEKAIEHGFYSSLIEHLYQFKGLEKDIFIKIIKQGDDDYNSLLFSYIGSFSKPIFNKADALVCINGRAERYIFEYANIFEEGIFDKDLALELIKQDRMSEINNLDLICKDIYKFNNLDKEVACVIYEKRHSEFIDKCYTCFNISLETIKKCASLNICLGEFLIIEDSLPPDFDTKEKEEKSKIIFSSLVEKDSSWENQENIIDPFKEGAEIFGTTNMFSYIYRTFTPPPSRIPGISEGEPYLSLSRHDGLHQFKKIIDLYKVSGLSAKEFYNNILMQVANDDGKYYSGSAHHNFNSIAISLSVDFEKTQVLVEQYKNLTKLQDLFKGFVSFKEVFASWKNLKKYKEVQELLEKRDILDKLSELDDYPDKQKLKDYIETLAFHPGISMEKVITFWQDTEDFLDFSDPHTPEEVHDRKKPSNYIDFPNLDLSAEDLRDALIEGDYDKIQSFKPFSIEYGLSEFETIEEDIASLINRSLGKRSKNIKGQAKNPPKLFKELTNFFSKEKMPLVLAGNLKLSKEDEESVRQIIFQEDIGLVQDKKNQEIYRAKINKKSDPDGVVAGNDTACCMPFGSGKNNVYTFNPNCALFTLQKQTSDNNWRTIAQSVLTEDILINKNISEIVSEMERGNEKINTIISDDVLLQQQGFIACDNIEVAENFKNEQEEIKIIYQDFFREYLKQFSQEDNFNNKKVVIGKGYTDALTDLPEEDNKFIPRAPVGYSDKLGNKVFILSLSNDFKTKNKIVSKNIVSQEKVEEKYKPDYFPKGIDYLTFKDALPVAYIEGKAYAENKSLIQYLHNMENALIAKDVNDAAKNRSNMSLKYVGDDKKIHGYILAYEGRIDKDGEEVIYVSDLASDGNIRAGGALILGFTNNYKYNYLDYNVLLPIYAQMREKTSYAIIKKQLEKLSEGSGLRFEIEELGSYKSGNDTMYEVLIRPIE